MGKEIDFSGMHGTQLETCIRRNNTAIRPVVPVDKNSDRLLRLDFTEANKDLTPNIINDTRRFSVYIDEQLAAAKALYGIGGYDEHRTVYTRSQVFDGTETGEEPRRLHLGIDIWGKAGTPVFAPLDGQVHSYAFNDRYGDYGATIILMHTLDGYTFHSLYGHLSLQDLAGLEEGKKINAGQQIAHFGESPENGHWPPHLHLQLVIDMEANKGDYPGVCKFSERKKYMANCPDPDLLLGMMQYADKNI